MSHNKLINYVQNSPPVPLISTDLFWSTTSSAASNTIQNKGGCGVDFRILFSVNTIYKNKLLNMQLEGETALLYSKIKFRAPADQSSNFTKYTNIIKTAHFL